MTFRVPEKYRVKKYRGNDDSGVFYIPRKGKSSPLRVIASGTIGWQEAVEAGEVPDGILWEHVSVSLPTRCPTWEEICKIKSLFWDENDVVVQYHPAKKDYVNMHPYCLHLFRPVGIEMPKPPKIMVGL